MIADPLPPKTFGCCICCGEPVYEIISWYTEGPLTGQPNRLGPMLDTGTQLEFLLSNGSEADIACCDACANAVTPEQYPAIWQSVIDRADLSFQIAGRMGNERRTTLASLMRLWPVALIRRRHEDRELNRLAVDRRA